MRKRRTGIVLAGAVMLLLIVLGMYGGHRILLSDPFS